MTSLDRQQVHKAATALLKHVELEKEKDSNLLDDDLFITLQIGLKKVPEGKKNAKPIPLHLRHPIYASEAASEVCIFVKDPQSEFKKKVEEQSLSNITKVIGISKLRSNYKPFEAKRELVNSYDLFLADDRVIPLLPKLIGSKFFTKKKQPLPVNLTKKNLSREIQRALASTSLVMGGGPCVAVKVARSSQSAKEVTENIVSVAEQVAKLIPRKWKNIQTMHIKTHSSVALPIFHSLPEGTTRIPSSDIASSSNTQGASGKGQGKGKGKGKQRTEDGSSSSSSDEDSS
eukprot:TRINITY_DN10855_c0_g1_i1.p1 TRINITY_DN10855_c0_g1~~TRINITY_DN10855_c0_g1_i1.p1  ORF type:complete len:288 (+),score=97.52 TRINITY_DN10855_c0_g1_i1:255-1118(+)